MKVELYVLRPESPKPVKLDIFYEDYIQPAVLWATEDTKDLAKALDVVKVVTEGVYIMGLFGGEKKSGMEHYAGLVVNSMKPTKDGLYVKLFNTDKEYLVPAELMKRYGVDVYKVYYGGRINPFKCSTLDVILSSIGEDELKKFIWELIRTNKEVMSKADEARLRKLAEEVKAEAKVLNSSSHYVMYRGNRIFTACVPEDLDKAVSQHHAAYIECKSAEQTYYYAAVFNYMAYKAIRRGREFVRHQHARPSIALVTAGLTWKDLPPQLKSEIANLSHVLSKRLIWRDYSNQREALLEAARRPEFAQIIKLLDKHIESTGKQEMLEEALRFVSGSRRGEK